MASRCVSEARTGHCGRVVQSLRRAAEEDFAQGLSLPGPPAGVLATFAGHKWAWRTAKCTQDRNSALVVGCIAWHKDKRLRRSAGGAHDCLCGGRTLSRAHLLWNCSRAADLVQSVPRPVNRLEERLLARQVPEIPKPPVALDFDDLVDSFAGALDVQLQVTSVIFVAADASVVDSFAA